MCAAPLSIWVGVTLYGANESSSFEISAPSWTTVERARKGDRLTPPVAADAADSAFASVEVAGRFDSAIIIRDKHGRLLYSADPASQTTVIAKRTITRERSPVENLEPSDSKRAVSAPGGMPDGCEGAFSPYAAPRMAHIIGRCISGIAGKVQVAPAVRWPTERLARVHPEEYNCWTPSHWEDNRSLPSPIHRLLVGDRKAGDLRVERLTIRAPAAETGQPAVPAVPIFTPK
jgi:hypothetical protein